MTAEAPELWLIPKLSLAAFLNRTDIRRSVEADWRSDLSWRWADRGDWPTNTMLFGAFAHAKRDGFGFIADVEGKRLFAVPRGWDEPEWELAEIKLADGRWRTLGYFEPWSPTWVMPALRVR